MDFKWYTLAVYSGSEAKVSNDINRMAESNDNIREAFVPVKKVFKISKGKKVEATQKIFPNYIFVCMKANRSTIDELRGMPKVMGFLGNNPLKPESVPEEKINKLKQEAEKDLVIEEDSFEIGDSVRINDGHFESFTGIIEGKDEVKNILKVSISIFGRNTIIELDPTKVEKI